MGGGVRVSGGSRVLLMRPTAVGKKLFLWHEVLVLMDLSLLPEGRDSKSLCPGWEGSAAIFPPRLRVLEAYGSWRDGRLQPIALSAERGRFGRLHFFSCRRKYILFCAFLMRELMFSSHLRSWEMMEPRKRKVSTQGDGGLVGLRSSGNPQPPPLSLERLAPICCDCTRLPDGLTPPEMSPMRVVSSANFRSLTDW